MIDFSPWIVHAFVILNLISITTYLDLPPANKISTYSLSTRQSRAVVVASAEIISDMTRIIS